MSSLRPATLARWRLVLGRYAKDQLNVNMSFEQQRIENLRLAGKDFCLIFGYVRGLGH